MSLFTIITTVIGSVAALLILYVLFTRFKDWKQSLSTKNIDDWVDGLPMEEKFVVQWVASMIGVTLIMLIALIIYSIQINIPSGNQSFLK